MHACVPIREKLNRILLLKCLAILKKILLRDFVSGTAVASELSRPTGLSSLCYNAHCDNLMEVALFSIMSVCGWMGGWVGRWVGGWMSICHC